MNSMLRIAKGLAQHLALAAIVVAIAACGGGDGGYGGGGGGSGGGGGGGGGNCDPIYGGNCPPSPSAYTMSRLVSNGAVAAAATDAHLRNPWGLAALPTSPFWVANNQDHSATLYDGTGLVQSLMVSLPTDGEGPGEVTGIVASSSNTDFMITDGTTTAPARFLFVTQGGALSGWAPTVDATNARIVYQASDGAEYTGLAIGTVASGTLLYAADFHNGRIDIFDSQFTKLDGTNKFVDATLPAGYAPFNIQAVPLQGSTVLAVAYARRDAVTGEEITGAGLGMVNIFSTTGTLLSHLIAPGGQLNAPWGIAVAPANFGTLSGALLVGNFGDGRINGFNGTTGAFLHALGDSTGTPIVNSGLWGIAFGNGARNQPANVLYLTAGINGETDGVYARIDLGASAPDIVAPTGVAVTAPAAAEVVSNTVTVSASAADNVGVARVLFQVRVGGATTDIGAPDTTAPYSVSWNTGTVPNGAATLLATAFDAFGNATASAGVAVTVNNVPDATPPTVTLTAPAAGNVSGTVTVSADATDNVGVAQVQFFAGATLIGTDTSAPYSVQWNTTGLAGVQQLTAQASDGAGNSTTSTAVAVTVVATVTLAQLQANIFTPRCSGCHTGGGGALPASMNLSSTASTYNALVNVDSLEAAGLKRVLPGNPANSYLVRKLEGTAGIVGERMPFGGPYLSTTEINQVRDWIQAGALQ